MKANIKLFVPFKKIHSKTFKMETPVLWTFSSVTFFMIKSIIKTFSMYL